MAASQSRTVASRIRRRVLSLFATLVVGYVAFLIVALVAQERFIYPGAWMLEAPPAPGDRPALTVLKRDLGDMGSVEAFLVIPEGAERPAPLVVMFHGNAELIDDCLGEAEARAIEGFAVLLPEYRGYGRSGGKPGAKSIREDAAVFLETALQDPRIDADRVAFIGRSLGGAVAADLAAIHPPRAIVLESTFVRLSSMFARAGLPSFVVRHPYDSVRALERFSGHMMIVHGDDDGVIPPSHGRALRDRFPQARYFEPRAGHYPSIEWIGYDAELRRFLSESGVTAQPTRSTRSD